MISCRIVTVSFWYIVYCIYYIVRQKKMEVRGIDPRAPRMQSECSTIWATPPYNSSVGRSLPSVSLCGNDKKNKNSPTGIRTPVFHVTGEDTNQLYYWRLLIYSKRAGVKAGILRVKWQRSIAGRKKRHIVGAYILSGILGCHVMSLVLSVYIVDLLSV